LETICCKTTIARLVALLLQSVKVAIQVTTIMDVVGTVMVPVQNALQITTVLEKVGPLLAPLFHVPLVVISHPAPIFQTLNVLHALVSL
jgi:hypothetical protein